MKFLSAKGHLTQSNSKTSLSVRFWNRKLKPRSFFSPKPKEKGPKKAYYVNFFIFLKINKTFYERFFFWRRFFIYETTSVQIFTAYFPFFDF